MQLTTIETTETTIRSIQSKIENITHANDQALFNALCEMLSMMNHHIAQQYPNPKPPKIPQFNDTPLHTNHYFTMCQHARLLTSQLMNLSDTDFTALMTTFDPRLMDFFDRKELMQYSIIFFYGPALTDRAVQKLLDADNIYPLFAQIRFPRLFKNICPTQELKHLTLFQPYVETTNQRSQKQQENLPHNAPTLDHDNAATRKPVSPPPLTL